MADSKLLVPELNEAETMGTETARFQELLLQASKEIQQAQMSRPESTQIQPQPGFCIKTNSSQGKVFINICHSPSIPPPADMTEDELLQMLEEDQAAFRIPMSLGEAHAELDAKGQGCTAYDVAVNSDFYRRMQNSDFLRELVMGGSQQLYHLDAYIPLRINADESRAAFHRKRRQLMVAMPLLSAPS
uniref:PIH1 domain containing 1 n=1 Tax=Rousettus aegyptiacus TaxID=9407 RepID=A0A7J8CKK6_ROUAE|nr:PIH1 domain containing 1 [Rousettus aegyptiacus]